MYLSTLYTFIGKQIQHGLNMSYKASNDTQKLRSVHSKYRRINKSHTLYWGKRRTLENGI